MKVTILKTTERPLLSRSRIYAEVAFDAAVPARKEIIEKIAAQVGVEADLVVVKKIAGAFGSRSATVAAYVYKSKAERDRIEEKKKLVRTGFNIPKIEKKVAPAQ
jgi:ribosomal protein S24E